MIWTSLLATQIVVFVVRRRTVVEVHLVSAAVSDNGISVAASLHLIVHTVLAIAAAIAVPASILIVPPAAICVAGVNHTTRSPASAVVFAVTRLFMRVAPPKLVIVPALE